MKTLASAKIRKAENKFSSMKVFQRYVREIFEDIYSCINVEHSPFFKKENAGDYVLVIVSADTGFCGSFNYNIIRTANDFIEKQKAKGNPHIIAVGRKVISSFKRRKIKTVLDIPKWNPDFATAEKIKEKFLELYLSGKADKVFAVYSCKAQGLKAQPVTEQILPLKPEKNKRNNGLFKTEPDPIKAFEGLVPFYLNTLIHRILLESKFQELLFRVQAMTNASENADHLVDVLTLQYFRARQENITKEIIEITSGAEAMK